jgi:anaerobic nitric oxide reductase flavorubredoxin
MSSIEIKPKIYWIGVDDRTTDLFEGLWPISKEGVSYNAYLINDDKKIIIDLAKSLKADEFFTHIAEITAISELDYVIVNHMEPDHTGVISTLRKIAPDITIIASKKAEPMLAAFYGIDTGIKIVEDGEELQLGTHTLKFFSTPFVHWPETIMTYEKTQGILFSCDAFGSYGALGGSIFDDDCLDIDFYKTEALRYYANIVAKFSGPVLQAIKKLADLKVSIIAPSHGRVWRAQPATIIKLYKKWAEYATSDAEPGVTLIYGSMYGNTETMMNAVAQGIADAGAPYEIFDAARVHPSYILSALWKYRGVMIGAPTYEGELFPPVANVLNLAVHKRITGKKAARFGSYGWSGGAQRHFERIIAPLKWNIVDSFEFNGGPTPEDLKKGFEFGAHFGKAILTTP